MKSPSFIPDCTKRKIMEGTSGRDSTGLSCPAQKGTWHPPTLQEAQRSAPGYHVAHPSIDQQTREANILKTFLSHSHSKCVCLDVGQVVAWESGIRASRLEPGKDAGGSQSQENRLWTIQSSTQDQG